LVEFVDALPPLLHLIKKNAARRTSSLLHATTHDVEAARGGTSFDPVMDLFGRLDLTSRGIDDDDSDSDIDVDDGRYWWDRYAHPDPMKNYTRNLIATDDETYTLLLLCWNPGKSSPIHDHPCDGCWVRVCEGKIQETRYEVTENDENETGTSTRLVMISDAVIEDSMPTFIHDSIGYHKVGNPSDAQVAVTLHLYCPPVKECKIWHDPADSSRPSTAVMHNHTEYGIRINDP
jgi:cysteine dioxygenase